MTKKAIIVRGGWEGHQPAETTELFLPFLTDNGYQCTIHQSPEVYADAATMAETDLVVQCLTQGTIEPDQVSGLRQAIEAGTGMAGWHGGITDSFRANADYLQLIGAQFAHHPGVEPQHRQGTAADNFIPHRIEMLPEAADHPITTGIDSFDLVTEQYWVLHDQLLDVLATTTLDARPTDPWHRQHTSPAVWTRRWGTGRIFATTIGHDVDTVAQPQVRTMIARGMLWASR